MASIINGSIVAEIKGSVGSETYSRNAYGPYVKSRVAPTNPNTTAQQNARAVMTAAVAAWQSLTDAQRSLYNAEARNRTHKNRLGLPTRMTGYNLFIRQFQLADREGVSDPTSVEPPQLRSSWVITNISADSTELVISATKRAADSSERIALYASDGRISSQLSFNPSTLRFLDEGGSASAGETDFDITTEYETVFGALSGKTGDLITVGINTYRTDSAELFKTQYLNQIIAA